MKKLYFVKVSFIRNIKDNMKSFMSLMPIKSLQSLDVFLKRYFSPKANFFNFESKKYAGSDRF